MYDKAIIVSQTNYTTDAKKISEIDFPDKFELFLYTDLMKNVTKTILYSEHILLSDEDVDAMLEERNVALTALPQISYIDPVNRYLKGRIGQVFKIIRDIDHGVELNYRLVVPVPLDIDSDTSNIPGI